MTTEPDSAKSFFKREKESSTTVLILLDGPIRVDQSTDKTAMYKNEIPIIGKYIFVLRRLLRKEIYFLPGR